MEVVAVVVGAVAEAAYSRFGVKIEAACSSRPKQIFEQSY